MMMMILTVMPNSEFSIIFIICVLIYGNMYMCICRVLSCFLVFHLEERKETTTILKILNE
jgi:hypothetical protein